MGASARLAGQRVREGFLEVVMLQLRSEGSKGGSRVTGKNRVVWQGAGPVPGRKRRGHPSWEEPGTWRDRRRDGNS